MLQVWYLEASVRFRPRVHCVSGRGLMADGRRCSTSLVSDFDRGSTVQFQANNAHVVSVRYDDVYTAKHYRYSWTIFLIRSL